MKVRKVFALSILATSVALAAGCSSDDDDATPVTDTDGMGTDTDGMGTDTDGMGTDTDGMGTDTDGMGTDTDGMGTDTDGMGATPPPPATAEGMSIIDVARGTDPDGDGVFEGAAMGLEQLVTQLGNYPDLVDLLDDESTMFTVFAPSDEAFAAADLSGLDEAAIRNVLTYHVVPGDMPLAAGMLTTAQGSMLEIRAIDDGDEDDTNDMFEVVGSDDVAYALTADGTVTAPVNGTVYVISGILTPGEAPMTEVPDMTETPTGASGSALAAVTGDDELTEFAAIVNQAGFNQSLESADNNGFIVLAPTNDVLDDGLSFADQAAALEFVQSYVIVGDPQDTSAPLVSGTTYSTVGNSARTGLLVEGTDDMLTINGSSVTLIGDATTGGTVYKLSGPL